MFGTNNGMVMMLKSFGLDPDALVKGAEEFKEVAINAQKAMVDLNERSMRIEQKLDLLLQNPLLNTHIKPFSHEEEFTEMELVKNGR